MKQLYNTALYMRLSRDDENYGDSVSIETQRTILRQYARDNNLNVVDEYIDDGWSGTNFERPAFIRMMNDVEAGKINCIVTKDLSRFGREHVMMDYYLEFVFPEKEVRYIAVAENEDTEKGLSDFVPFKNLFNEWFAKDTSRKVKQSLKAKFLEGERVCNIPPIGYKKHPEIKNKLVIDEETRWIIEKIFDMAAHGAGGTKIMKKLIADKVPTPGWLAYERYGAFSNIYSGNDDESKKYLWRLAQVQKILTDETYIGNTVHYRQTGVSYKSKKKIRNSEENLLRIENTHEGIISKELFDQVQNQIASRRRTTSDGTTQIFAGLLKCSDCGGALRFSTCKNTSKPFAYYSCRNYGQYGKEYCRKHYIRYDTLYGYVLSRIAKLSDMAEKDEEKLLQILLRSSDKEKNALTKKRTTDLEKSKKRKAEVDRLFAKMYEDWVNERITEYNFNMMSRKYQAEQRELDEKISRLKTALATEKQTVQDAQMWISRIKQYSHPTELTAELLNSLIEKIVVHESKKNEFGFKEQDIEIYYRFIGKID